MFSDNAQFKDLVNIFLDLLDLLVVLIFAVTLVVIVWKVIDAWVIHPGDENKVTEGKQTVLISIIALVVMSSIWGIVWLIQSSIFGGV